MDRDTAVWNGYASYDGGRFPVWARVRIRVRISRVVAVRDLKPGETIEAASVRLEESEGFPRRSGAAASLEGIVGRVPRHLIAAAAEVTQQAVEEPHLVEKGDVVAVEVHCGAAVLKLEGSAETPGRGGDTISVRNLETGKPFRGRVQQKGLVLVDCDRNSAPNGHK
jgi:flagella basal body P-ring formation protein FlgA